MPCKYFRKRTKKYKLYFYCTLLKKEIQYCDCKSCKNKKYKTKKSPAISGQLKRKPDSIKKKTSKLAKLERNRTSLFTNDLEHCVICGKAPINKHEIFGGRNRQNSIKYKLVIPLCTSEHHNQIEQKGIHFDTRLRDEWQKKGQVLFNETYPDLNFIEIFGKNYL